VLEQDEERAFEAEVLNLARALFAPEESFQGAAYLDGAERDGIFITSESVVIVECTVSRRKDKAEKDGKKLRQACDRSVRSNPYKSIKGYFVTRDEPTADQRSVISRLGAPIVACSIDQLRAMLINSAEYLSARDQYPFGSAQDPTTGDFRSLGSYVPLLLSRIDDGSLSSIEDIGSNLICGARIVLVGDYGAGKSMTLRELFKKLETKHRAHTKSSFPVFLNLRDHQGQTDPAEALERHAKRIGFGQPSRLVRTWLSGGITLFLDGFDEIATPGWLGRTSGLRDIRRRSVELIRQFVQMTPSSSGVIVAGRSYFFDSNAEMRQSLNLPGETILLSTSDFTDSQMKTFLAAKGWAETVPDWLPSRPLLLGYLAATGLLAEVAMVEHDLSPGAGWNLLLDRISAREATIEVGVDGPTVRRLIERLATLARRSPDGMGPLTTSDLTEAFQAVCGYLPDEGSYQLLQRLPGLGVQDPADGSRHFIDSSLADAARAGDIVHFIQDPYSTPSPFDGVTGTVSVLDSLGVDVGGTQLRAVSVSRRKVYVALERIRRQQFSDALAVDTIRVAITIPDHDSNAPAITIREISLPRLLLGSEASGLDSITFEDCIIQVLDLTEYEGADPLPLFRCCIFGSVIGVASFLALQPDRFVECQVEEFDATSRTTQGILSLVGLPPEKRVMLTILKKIYAQAGSGRQESALGRGLDPANKVYVSGAVGTLLSEGLIGVTRQGNVKVYVPVKGAGGRVRRILEAPTTTQDPIFKT
jgi:NACHT domain